MTARRVPAYSLAAVIAAVTAATLASLFARTVMQRQLVDAGLAKTAASDVSYLIVPPLLVVLLLPLWRRERAFLASLFRRPARAGQTAAKAAGVGMLLRLAWWCQLVAGVAFGLYHDAESPPVPEPVFEFRCAPPAFVLLGLLVTVGLQPLIEETVHRGYIQSAVQRFGFTASIAISAAAFAAVHPSGSMPFAFLAGLVFAAQYRISRSLWPSLISHATVNGLIQVDWRCLSGRWNPGADDLPLLLPGILASAGLFACLLGIVFVLRTMATGTPPAPR